MAEEVPELEAPRIVPRDAVHEVTVPEVKVVAIPPLDVHGADACASRLQELQRQAQKEQQQLQLRLQQMRGQELYQQLQQPSMVTPGAPPSWAASEPSWAPPEPSWSCPQYPTFNLQPVQLPPLGMPNLQPWAPTAPMRQSDPAAVMPNLLAPKGLAPPKGIAQPEPLRTYLEPPVIEPMMGGHSAGDPLCATLGSSEALPCGFGPSPGSGGAMPLSMPEPVTSLKHLAGISAKQDQEILHTLQSSGLALNLKSLDEPEADINQMLSMATQGSAHESKTSSAMPEPATASKVRLKSSSMVEAEEYVRGYRPQSHAHSIQYPSGVRVDFRELAPVMRVVAIANSQSLLRIQQAIDSGMHVRTALHAFRECDRDGCGFLTWSNGQIRDFVMTVFIQLGLVPPAEMQTYAAHTLFDMNRTMCLSACDCLCLVDALLRAIFLVDGQEQASRRPVSSFSSSLSSPVAEELKQAQAETERLRQELEELKAAEAAAAEDEHLGRIGPGEGDTQALVWTAKAHAENRRLERELKSLRELAHRQRGEVEWLSGLKQQLKSSRQEELEKEHQKLMEMQEEEHLREEAAAEEAAMRRQQQEEGRQRRLEALMQERSERRRRVEQREKELQEQEMEQEREQERLERKEQELRERELELHKEKEKSIQQAEALRGRELEVAKELGRWKAPTVISPSHASHVEPEEEADADAAEVAALAAAQSLENRKLRRELESLRALAQWQQSEVGAAIACKSEPRRSAATPGAAGSSAPSPCPAAAKPPRGALVMAALAGEALAEGHQERGPAQRSGLEEYDRTVHELMSRVLGRSEDLGSPGRSVLEPVTLH